MIGWGGKKIEIPFGIASSPRSQVFSPAQFPALWPFSPRDFERQDPSEDSLFYMEPRMVTHIDDGAISAIRNFYMLQFSLAPPGFSVLDLCSSWISHYPENMQASRVAITGMNEEELK